MSKIMEELEKKRGPILVGVIAGSPSDKTKLKEAVKILKEDFDVLGVAATYASAHRTPKRLRAKMKEYEDRGCRVFIALAGMAAHLGGAMAAETVMPVIAVPLSGSPLSGYDALLSTVQMPKGIPVATVAIDGAANAAILAVQILATGSEGFVTKLKAYREKMANNLEEKAEELAVNDGIPI